MLGSKKYRKDNHFESPKLGETKDERKLTILSNEHSGSLRSRLDNIEKALKTFLLYHQPREQRKLLKSAESVRMEKPKRLPPKAPSLIDVLSQSIAIAEYRVAIENLKDADLAISPDVEDVGSWQFNKAAQAISAGEKAASRVLLRSKPTGVISQFRP